MIRNFKKISFWSFLAVVLIVFPAFIALTVVNSKDCSQLVIDTYEIHSNINITSITGDFSCYYDEEHKMRINMYEVGQGHKSYTEHHKFEQVSLSIGLLEGYALLAPKERPQSPRLYRASGRLLGRNWTYLYESETGRLWTELVY
ncbi:MAG: hypothetical protein WD355_11935 [Balneolaceae bacterium]